MIGRPRRSAGSLPRRYVEDDDDDDAELFSRAEEEDEVRVSKVPVRTSGRSAAKKYSIESSSSSNDNDISDGGGEDSIEERVDARPSRSSNTKKSVTVASAKTKPTSSSSKVLSVATYLLNHFTFILCYMFNAVGLPP
jgi:hypothetical protein